MGRSLEQYRIYALIPFPSSPEVKCPWTSAGKRPVPHSQPSAAPGVPGAEETVSPTTSQPGHLKTLSQSVWCSQLSGFGFGAVVYIFWKAALGHTEGRGKANLCPLPPCSTAAPGSLDNAACGFLCSRAHSLASLVSCPFLGDQAGVPRRNSAISICS